MSGIIHEKDICKSILRKTAIIMLESEEKTRNLGIRKLGITSVPNYVGRIIVIHVNISSRVNPCYWQDWDCFKSGLDSKGLRELLSLLCNNESNVGDERMDNIGQILFGSGIVPKMKGFHGLVEKRYTFFAAI